MRTRDRVPLDWAATTLNLGILEVARFQKDGKPEHLDDARRRLEDALAVFRDAGAEHYVRSIEDGLQQLELMRMAAPLQQVLRYLQPR